MKKFVLFLSVFFVSFSFNSFGQSSQKTFHKHNNFNHHNNLNFAGGLIAGFFLNEVLGSSNNYRDMYFVYNPIKDNWRLKKDVYKNQSYFYSNTRIIARFENPTGGRDFLVKVNKRGQWFLDCPIRLKKLLKNKVRKNI